MRSLRARCLFGRHLDGRGRRGDRPHPCAQPVPPSRSELLNTAIQAHLREPNGFWFGFTTGARVIMYNKAMIKAEQLSTYEDLADPKWKGKLLVNSSTVTYNQSLVASMIAQHGVAETEKWARGIVATMARAPKAPTVI